MSTPGCGHRWDGPLWRVFLVSGLLAAAIFGSCLLADQVLNDTSSSNLLAALFYGFPMGMMEMLLERRRRRRGSPDA